jgi:hypothetical protein
MGCCKSTAVGNKIVNHATDGSIKQTQGYQDVKKKVQPLIETVHPTQPVTKKEEVPTAKNSGRKEIKFDHEALNQKTGSMDNRHGEETKENHRTEDETQMRGVGMSDYKKH